MVSRKNFRIASATSFRVGGIGEMDRFISRQCPHQPLVQCDKFGLLFSGRNARQDLGFAGLETQSGQKPDAAGMRVTQAELC
jgi:hypothetical protein